MSFYSLTFLALILKTRMTAWRLECGKWSESIWLTHGLKPAIEAVMEKIRIGFMKER